MDTDGHRFGNWLRKLFRRKAARSGVTRPPTAAEAKARELRQLHTLASMDAEHPVWVTILEIVDDHEGNMVDRVMAENLTDEQRHYAAGLAADARYLGNALRDLKLRADVELGKKQRAE